MAVEVRLTGLEEVRGRGQLRSLLTAELEIGGVVLTIQGIQVREDARGFALRWPEFRAGDGRWWPALVAPDVIGQALLEAWLEAEADA